MNTKIINLLILNFALMTIGQIRAEDTPTAKSETAKLQGEWTMVSGSADGYPMPDTMISDCKRVCKQDETTVIVGEHLFMQAKFTLDPSKKPHTIDYQMIDGPTKGKQQLGIYEWDGETVRFCFGSAGASRPGDFTSKTGDGRTLSVWKRVKK